MKNYKLTVLASVTAFSLLLPVAVVQAEEIRPAAEQQHVIHSEARTDRPLGPEQQRPRAVPNKNTLGLADNRLDGKKSRPEDRLDGKKPRPEDRLDGKKPRPGDRLDGKKPHPEDRLDGKHPRPNDHIKGKKPSKDQVKKAKAKHKDSKNKFKNEPQKPVKTQRPQEPHRPKAR